MFRNTAVFKFIFEYIFHAFNDLGGVIVILGEDERFRNILPLLFPVRVQLFIDGIFVSRKHLADLITVNDRAV